MADLHGLYAELAAKVRFYWQYIYILASSR